MTIQEVVVILHIIILIDIRINALLISFFVKLGFSFLFCFILISRRKNDVKGTRRENNEKIR
jgi:hypothetical protein